MPALTQFRPSSKASAIARVRRFPLPLTPELRCAQITAGRVVFGGAQPFTLDETVALQSFDPQLLIGSSLDLESLARKTGAGNLTLNGVDRAIYVVTGCHDMPLRDTSRVVLWQTFGVPIYEVLLAGDGLPVAAECDAHEGWHTAEGVTFWAQDEELWFQRKRTAAQGTGLTGNLENGACPCGVTGQRVLNARMDFRDPLRHQWPKSA